MVARRSALANVDWQLLEGTTAGSSQGSAAAGQRQGSGRAAAGQGSAVSGKCWAHHSKARRRERRVAALHRLPTHLRAGEAGREVAIQPARLTGPNVAACIGHVLHTPPWPARESWPGDSQLNNRIILIIAILFLLLCIGHLLPPPLC